MRARGVGQEVVAEGIVRYGALGEVRHAVIVLLAPHVLPVPVDCFSAAKQGVMNVHHDAVSFTHLEEQQQ